MHGDIPRCWGIADALAWIAVRDAAISEVLQGNSSAGGLEIAIALAGFFPQGQISEFPTAKSGAALALLKALRAGDVKAWGFRNGSGSRSAIGAGEWIGLQFADTGLDGRDMGIIAEPIRSRSCPQTMLRGILVAADDIDRKWPARKVPGRRATKAQIEDKAKALMESGHLPKIVKSR